VFETGVGKTVWYHYSATQTRQIRVSTAGSSFDTVVAAWRNPTLGNFTDGYCSDDEEDLLTSDVTFPVAAGETYMIQIGGYVDPDAPGDTPESGTLHVSITALGTLTTSTTGSGTVTSDVAGISCGADCTEDYPSGTRLRLTATAAPGFGFDRWTDQCAGIVTPTCFFEVQTSINNAGATFVDCSPRPNVGVNVGKNGDGRLKVTVTPGAGLLKSIQINPANAVVDVVGGPASLAGTYTPAGGAAQVVLLLARQAASGSAQAGMAVTDACGLWSTLAGAGKNPNNWTPGP